MIKNFEIGATVKLKSGGPKMTVEEYGKNLFNGTENGMVACSWFVEGNRKHESFQQDALEEA
jgi:uncharacterized protein YodC (DUF2158 family)